MNSCLQNKKILSLQTLKNIGVIPTKFLLYYKAILSHNVSTKSDIISLFKTGRMRMIQLLNAIFWNTHYASDTYHINHQITTSASEARGKYGLGCANTRTSDQWKHIRTFSPLPCLKGTAHLKHHAGWMDTFKSGMEIFKIAFPDVVNNSWKIPIAPVSTINISHMTLF